MWKQIANWLRSTLAGNLTLFVVGVGFPFLLFFLVKFHMEGTLTVHWAIRMACYDIMIWSLGGLVFWFGYTKPKQMRKQIVGK